MTLEALAQQHNGREVDARALDAVNCDNIISPGLDGITNDMLKGAPQQVARTPPPPSVQDVSGLQGTHVTQR